MLSAPNDDEEKETTALFFVCRGRLFSDGMGVGGDGPPHKWRVHESCWFFMGFFTCTKDSRYLEITSQALAPAPAHSGS